MRANYLSLMLFSILFMWAASSCSQENAVPSPLHQTDEVSTVEMTLPSSTSTKTIEATLLAEQTAVSLTPTTSPPHTATPTPIVAPTPVPSPTPSLWGSLQNEESGSLQVVNQIGGRINVVTVQDNIAYLGVGPRLWTLDVADPKNPVELGQSDILPGIVRQIALAGDVGYVRTDTPNGFWIADLSEPSNPRILSFFETEMETRALQVRNGRLYLSTNEAVQVFSIENALLPKPIGTLPLYYTLLPNSNYIFTINSVKNESTTLRNLSCHPEKNRG